MMTTGACAAAAVRDRVALALSAPAVRTVAVMWTVPWDGSRDTGTSTGVMDGMTPMLVVKYDDSPVGSKLPVPLTRVSDHATSRPIVVNTRGPRAGVAYDVLASNITLTAHKEYDAGASTAGTTVQTACSRGGGPIGRETPVPAVMFTSSSNVRPG